MTSLYETLALGRDLRLVLLALLVAGAASCAAQHMMPRWAAASWPRRKWPAVAGVFGVGTWLTYVLMVLGLFPDLDPAADWWTNAQGVALAGGGGVLAVRIAARGRSGYRGLLLAGAVLAGATACTVFLGLSSLTRPHRLAFELLPVTGTVLAAAVLGGLGLASAARPRGALQQVQGAFCLAAAQVVPVAAGLASILSFSDWLTEADKPASLATEPVAVVLAACGLVVVLLVIAGSAADHHLAMRAERESERLRQLADGAMEGILIHRAGLVLDANTAFCDLVGAPLAAVRGRPVSELFAVPSGQCAPWEASGPGTGRARQEVEVHAPEGAVPVEALSRGITYKEQPAQVLAVRDIRERRAAEERIRHLAHHDGLTGLANRTLFGERMEHALAAAGRTGGVVAVLCLDLDRFKAVNDTLGHAAGDLLLQQVAARMLAAVREGDTVARMGGDEFVVLQAGGRQPHAATALAERLIEALCRPFDLRGQQACIGTSIGIALCPRDGANAGELLKSADVALYRAKTQGRGVSRLYEPDMDAVVRERQSLEHDLRAAVGTDQLKMHYQPIFSCGGDRAVVGFEALMRWTHPRRGQVSPADFIPLAEETGLIVPLGRWALEAACREAACWPARCRLAVNLSPLQFRGGQLPATVADILERTGLAAGRLELEVTENLLIGDTAQALTSLRGLKALGVRIALDDFGTGYSSLSYLRRFPFDKLKIDRSFIQALCDDAGARAIVEAILAMSCSLKLDVTAEGVETPDQLAALQAMSCATVQGFLLGRPMPSGMVPGVLDDHRKQVAGLSLCGIS